MTVAAVRYRPSRALVLGLGVLVSCTSFVLLTSAAETGSLQVRRLVAHNFRSAYDLLVRPARSVSGPERRNGLVRDNFLSGLYGGISFRQLSTIEGVPGVSVAAPIANIGTVMLSGSVTVPLSRLVDAGSGTKAFRARLSWVSNNLSHYPGGAAYLVWLAHQPSGSQAQLEVCNGFGDSQPGAPGPFAAATAPSFVCAWRSTNPLYQPSVYLQFLVPVQLAAISPVAENALVGLRHAVVSGSYLSDRGRSVGRSVPVIASTRPFLGDRLVVSVQQLSLPPAVSVTGALEAGSCSADFVPCPTADTVRPPSGDHAADAYGFVTGLRAGPVVSRSVIDPSAGYGPALSSGHISIDALWQASSVSYTGSGSHLSAQPVSNDPLSVWSDPFNVSGWFDAPPQNRDTAFRRLREIVGVNSAPAGGQIPTPALSVVGQFNPERLAGFSPLSRVPLETYYPPEVLAANAATNRALHGLPLLPSENIAGYVQQPPLLLTSMAGLRAFLKPGAFQNMPAAFRRAPIAAVRVRVAGVTGPNAISRARLDAAATLIHDRTGLNVSITAGSSPEPIDVRLAAGRFGTPAMLVREGWTKLGAAVSYLHALDRKSVLLFALNLLVCLLFLGNGAAAAMAARRSEIATLRTLGWSRRHVYTLMLSEFAVIGALAGLAGLVFALLAIEVGGLDLPPVAALLVPLLAVVITPLSAAYPVWSATGLDPVRALADPARPLRLTAKPRHRAGIALAHVVATPIRNIAAALALAVGVAATVLVLGVVLAFRGEVVTTLLGHVLTVHIRGVDELSVGLTVTLAAIALSDAIYLGLRERAGELSVLRAVGWSVAQVRGLVAIEALIISIVGALVGAVAGLALATAGLGFPADRLFGAAAVAGGLGVGLAQVAAAYPLHQISKLDPARLLAEE